MPGDDLIPKHGGYRRLKTFQLSQLIYDITVLFCQRFIDPRSRTHDQMVQAARSGTQNIAEGSKVSGTSKKLEMKLTNVARASLEELMLDFEDYLRQRGLEQWPPGHPVLRRFRRVRFADIQEYRCWIAEEHRKLNNEVRWTDTDGHGQAETGFASVPVRVRPPESVPLDQLVANTVLSLLNLNTYLLRQQVLAQARAFASEGGFTERLYELRQRQRRHR